MFECAKNLPVIFRSVFPLAIGETNMEQIITVSILHFDRRYL